MGTGRVLVADGDYDACDALVETLKGRGYQVDFAYDAPSALDLARQRPYGLIILDHWPPYLDAFGLDRRLRLAALRTPIVILDTAADGEACGAGLRSGVTRVLSRTGGLDPVLALLEEVLTRPAEIVAA